VLRQAAQRDVSEHRQIARRRTGRGDQHVKERVVPEAEIRRPQHTDQAEILRGEKHDSGEVHGQKGDHS
jgi:hypothetical protein